jgi:PKHD-type hydroxylase
MKFQYYLIPDFLDQLEISNLNEILEKNKSEENQEHLDKGHYVKTKNVNLIQHSSVWDDLDRFRNMILHVNRYYFGLDLFEISKYNTINYNLYDSKNQDQYTWHCDAEFNECFDLKLTALLNISNEKFDGGELMLFLGGELEIEGFKKPGSLLIFPSWVQHTVKPVTSGTRKTISSWIAGPNWK